MLKLQDSQFKLMEDGQIFYQQNPTNPLPGVPVATVAKGEAILKPTLSVTFSELSDEEKQALDLHLNTWLTSHISSVLEPLVQLEAEGEFKPAVKQILSAVHSSLGIVPRESLEGMIAQIDQDDRKALRDKKVRLGPLLVFIPALNKPAAVRLRALLWALWNGGDIPVQCPKDGIVSLAVDPASVNKEFYQAIGYPVFGSRAMRIDMLDRVICAVYDSAKDGKFQAQHQMAEWLGCSIAGLYDVLEAMGHKKIHDPARQDTVSEPASTIEILPASEKSEPPVETAEAPTPTPPAAKPELATFRLKRGKAFEQARPLREKKPYKKSEQKTAETKSESNPQKFRGSKKSHKPERKDIPRVISSGPAPRLEDSPFAILGQLKKKSDG